MEIPEDRNAVMARLIAEKVAAEGGRTFYVGGLVRDRILGIDSKDVDIDGEYAAFGYVVYGLGAVDSIAGVTTGDSDKPTVDVVIESAKFVTLK